MTPAQQQQHDYLLTQLSLLIRSNGNGGLTSAEDLRTFEELVINQLFADPNVSLDSGPADPTASQGNSGDFWLNETSGWLWRKYDPSAAPATGGWIKRTLLRGQDSQVAGPQGVQGRQGIQGIDGKNAYQLAVQQGYTGTLTQWLLGLKGNDGPSAYQVAVANGYQGTALQWLASLKGAASTVPGPQGPDGPQGKTGGQGPKGADGLSAYQVAVAGGYTGTQAQWLASLAANGATFPIPANHWGAGYPPVALVDQTAANEYFGGRIAAGAATPAATTSPSLTAALAIAVASITAGNPVTFTVTAGGGTSPYAYQVVATNQSTGAQVVLGNSAGGTWTPQTPGSYNIDATVTDASSPQKTAQATTRTLQVTSVANLPPVANAGADTTITLPTSMVQLMGTGSDPDAGDTVSYAWAQVTGPNTALLATPNLQNTTASNLVAGSYQFSLTPTDNHGLAGTKSYVVVHVNPVTPPTISSYTPSSGPIGTQVSIFGANFGSTQGTGNVKFNGVLAQIVSWAATLVVAIVPSSSTGPLTLTTDTGTAITAGTYTVTAASQTITLSQQGIVSDTNLAFYPTLGTDQTAAIQSLLNQANGTDLFTVNWDVKVTGKQFRIKSNTKIRFFNGGGAAQAAGYEYCFFVNANRAGATGSLNLTDYNITLESGDGTVWTLNGNGYNSQDVPQRAMGSSDEGWAGVLGFHGVAGLNMTGGQLYNSRTIMGFIGNCQNVTSQWVQTLQNPFNTTGDFQTIARHDGIKFFGPLLNVVHDGGDTYTVDDSFSVITSGDVWFPDRNGLDSFTLNKFVSYGYIKKFSGKAHLIAHPLATGANNNTYGLHGVRLMSTTELAQDWTIELSGTAREYMLNANNLQGSAGYGRPNAASYAGQFTNLKITAPNGFNVIQTPSTDGNIGYSAGIALRANFNGLQLADIVYSGHSASFPFLKLDPACNIDNLYGNNWTIAESAIPRNAAVFNGAFVGTKTGNVFAGLAGIANAIALIRTNGGSVASGVEQSALTLENNLSTAGVLRKLYAYYPMLGVRAQDHQYNVKDLRDTDDAFRLRFLGTWQHDAQGIDPDGLAGTYGRTFYQPAYKTFTPSRHFAFYSLEDIQTGRDFGFYSPVTANQGDQLHLRYTDDHTYYAVGAADGNQQTTPAANGGTNSIGFYVVNFVDGKAALWKNGVKISEFTQVDGFSSLEYYFGNMNVDGAPSDLPSARKMGWISMGDALTDAQVQAYSSAVNSLLSAKGFDVSLGNGTSNTGGPDYGGPTRQAPSSAAFVALQSTTMDMASPNRTLAINNLSPDPLNLLFSGTAVGQVAQLRITNTDSAPHTLQLDTNSLHVIYSNTGNTTKTIVLAAGQKLGIQVDFTQASANYYVNYAPTDF